MKTQLRRWPGMGWVLACLAGPLSADSVTNEFTIPNAAPDWLQTLSVPKLYLSVGDILDSVVIELQGTLKSDLYLQDFSGLQNNVYATYGGAVKAELPGANTTITNPLSVATTNLLLPFQQLVVSNLVHSLTSTVTATDPNAFVGVGNVNVKVSAAGFLSGGGSLNGKDADAGGSDALVNAVLKVIYNYTPVPEAGTMGAALMLAGTVGWIWRRARQKARLAQPPG